MPRKSFWPAFWRLARPYFSSDDRWAARGLFVAITTLALAIIWVNVQLNEWNGEFYNSLQDKRFDDFQRLLLQFGGWATLYIVLAVYQLYLNQMLQMRWRRWLTDVWLQRWLADAAHYRLSLADFGTDNPDQRIAEDFRAFVDDTLGLFFGLLSSTVSFLAFVGILWSLSGPLTLAGVTVPGYMVWVAIGYALGGSLLAHYIGRPLIGLNFQQQRYEADFRFALVRARENAEGIALYRGEPDELAGFRLRFGHVVANWWRIMLAQKRYTWFSSFYGQLAIVFPFLVAAPRYFSGAIQLGGLMQIGNAFGEVQKALSWFVDAYVRLAGWRASIDRLDGFIDAIERARALGAGLQVREGDAVDLGGVTVSVPVSGLAMAGNGRLDDAAAAAGGAAGAVLRAAGEPVPATRALFTASGQRIEPGRHTLLTGPSGSGKSTLFRLLSGIWPFGEGACTRPRASSTLFLPQKPYLPLGTLREAVHYPRVGAPAGDDALRALLHDVRLGHLAARLDETAHWSQVLSPGEQQRLAIARALLLAPDWLFLDEATSALDEPTEQAMYELLRDRLPDTTLVSIAHRPAVARHHLQRLEVEQGGTLALRPLAPASP